MAILVIALVMYYQKFYGVDDDAKAEDALWSHVPALPRRFSYKELQSITNNFSEQMGKGGFGAVYAGVLQDGTKVAVKRLESLRQGAKEFRAEVVILGGVHHYNLVELVGYCAEGSSHRLLVYEYMANGSLDQWVFAAKEQQNCCNPLPWKHRFNIALGAARGLAYLHNGCKDLVVHLDIKPQNILLDDNFVAKVSDFGLSTLMGRDESRVITTMRGTPGYLAPEWLAEGLEVFAKCDVFSYGKLLMELLGAPKNLDPSMVEGQEKI
ncbi:hypothetical protein L7F22_060039 [Adiantum nelumboides]|nr:hypothetical protein [Adiantum nelumboides]